MESVRRPHLYGKQNHFGMKKSIWILAALFLCLSAGFTVPPQTRTITGKVTAAADGNPIPGVTVILKGTSSGTTTNHEGKYSISVPANGGTLVFSFIGYKSQEIKIGTNDILDIKLVEDVTQLSEVVTTKGRKKQSPATAAAAAWRPLLLVTGADSSCA